MNFSDGKFKTDTLKKSFTSLLKDEFDSFKYVVLKTLAHLKEN